MILGLIAGGWLRESAPRDPAAAAGRRRRGRRWRSGWLLHVTGICPVVKRIWTPSWMLFSGGWCFLLLAAFCW